MTSEPIVPLDEPLDEPLDPVRRGGSFAALRGGNPEIWPLRLVDLPARIKGTFFRLRLKAHFLPQFFMRK